MTLRRIIIASTLLIVLSLCSLAAMMVFFTNNNNNTTTSNWNTRRRQLSQMQLTTSPHHGYGTHFVTVHMGGTTQPQTLALALDSDHTSVISDDSCLSIPLEYFHTCPAQCHYPESSCSSDNKYCQVTVQYSDSAQASGYIGAELTNNEFHLSPLIKFPLSYICQQELFGPVRTPDGILGMSTSPNSFIHQYYNSLFQAKEHRMFSMCFRPFSSYAVGSSAGMVTVGHVDPEQLDSPIVYAANHGRVVTKHDYAVRIRKMYMGVASDLENPLVAFADGTMSVMPLGSDWNTDTAGNAAHLYQDVDGTHDVVPIHTNSVLTSFPKSLEQAFVATFSRMTQSVEHPNGHTYALPSFHLTKHDYDQLPTLFIQLEAHQMAPDNANSYIADFVPGFAARHDPHHPLDVILAVKPQHYISYHEDTEKAMPTLLFSDTGTQLASNIFQEMEVVLDLTRNKIGFAQRFHCPPGLTVTHTKELICHSDETRLCDDNDRVRVLNRQPELNCHFPACPPGTSATGTRTGTVAMQEGPLGGELDGQGASVASSTGTTNGSKKGRTTDSNVLIPNQYRGKDTIPYFRQPEYDQQPVPMAEGPLGKSVYAIKIGESAKQADADLAARHSKGFNETALFSTWTMVGFVIFATSFLCTALCTQKEFFKVAEWLAGFEINNETVGKGMEAKLGPSTYEDEKRAETAWLKGKSFYSQHPRRPIRKEPNMRGVQTSHQYAAAMQQQAVYQPPVYSKAGPKQVLLTRKYENDYIDDDDDEDESTEYLTESSEYGGPFMTIHAHPHQHARKLSMTSTMSGNDYYH